jgi:hypothetical protein
MLDQSLGQRAVEQRLNREVPALPVRLRGLDGGRDRQLDAARLILVPISDHDACRATKQVLRRWPPVKELTTT